MKKKIDRFIFLYPFARDLNDSCIPKILSLPFRKQSNDLSFFGTHFRNKSTSTDGVLESAVVIHLESPVLHLHKHIRCWSRFQHLQNWPEFLGASLWEYRQAEFCLGAQLKQCFCRALTS